MSNRKLVKAIQGLFRDLKRLHQTVTKGLVNWLLRSALKNNRGNRLASGFVLPTTVLLVLVVTLTVGALTYRAYNRNAQVIGENQQRIIYNAATPAIDRARSKLEYLFDATKDTRYPGGVPGEDRLLAMLYNDGRDAANANDFAKLPTTDASGLPFDPYELLDEKRVDLNGDGRNDNAWSFRTDTDGDKTADATVIYSIIFRSPVEGAKNPQELLLTKSNSYKAEKLWVRQGPLSRESNAVKCGSGSGGSEGGWFEDRGGSTSILRKNFQVDAMVIPDQANSTVVTLEFNQDRQLNRGNKWGAWFRNDLEIFPGPAFNWNGAMHTEGSLMLGGTSFTAHLISSPASCLYSPAENSGITVTDTSTFKGAVIAGRMRDDSKGGKATIYIHGKTSAPVDLTPATDSSGAATPYSVSIDPKAILVADQYQYREDRTGTGNSDNWTNLKASGLDERITPKTQDKPYVDDLYRADDRWGPKPKYGAGDEAVSVPPGDMGKDIPSGSATLGLTLPDDDAPGSAGSGVGLDGYWERRARGKGLRILVGERLELGNFNTWVTPNGGTTNPDYVEVATSGNIASADEKEGDPLYPPTIAPYPISQTDAAANKLQHLDLQRRTLRDNLSAVQATAVYHSAKDRDYPVACLASTVHPGTLSTLYESINFQPTLFADGAAGARNQALQSNFFTGQGTNGWEFSAPSGTATAFATAMNDATSPLRTALQNLANFAGDPDGVFPLAPTNTAVTHPYPALSMWGNFSNLRRVLGKLGVTTYGNLSIADKTYLQTASCTLGVLAYNIDQIQKFDPTNVNNDYDYLGNNTRVITKLADDLYTLMNGDESDGEVLPTGQMASRDYDPNSPRTGITGLNKDVDYREVPPEAWIGALKQRVLKGYLTTTPNYQAALAQTLNDSRVRMAEMIMLKYQIRRDRSYGFRSSPAFGSYVAQAAGTGISGSRNEYILPSACNPDDFKFNSFTEPVGLTGPTTGAGVVEGRYRLALSRLCGALDTTNYNPDDSTKRAWVLPKFPALYYIFPEINHGLTGALETATPLHDHRQPGSVLKAAVAAVAATDILKSDSRAANDEEPYIKADYVGGSTGVNTSVTFEVVGTAIPITPPVNSANPSTPTASAASAAPVRSSHPYTGTTPSPIAADYSLGAIALTPKSLSNWQLPHTAPQTNQAGAVSGGPNVSPNIIVSTDGTKIAVPFLDRALFDARQVMLMRSLDIDLGMLRSSGITGTTTDVWLPESGIVYAFREDAVREDAITRPAGTGTDLRNPSAPKDPPLETGISPKAVDYRPDPERRVHGFRLRNGAEIKRKNSLLAAAKNIRGLSFFTDQPVFIQGDFNLHQDGSEDTAGTRLEEFTQVLPDNYSASQFYGRTATNYDNFSAPAVDRWRPSEVLADSIGILSNNFCDGSIADTFVAPNLGNRTDYPVADFSLLPGDDANRENPRAQYGSNTVGLGLFGPGCTGSGYTSFHNRNIPQKALPLSRMAGQEVQWDWVRENSSNSTLPQGNLDPKKKYWADFTSPVKISRTGQPLIEQPQPNVGKGPLPRPIPYKAKFSGDPYYSIGEGGKKLMSATPTRVNSIVVSGIVPSRKGQSYGGLHNFPRFLEKWNGVPLNFSGSFLQLSFSNYGTAPYELEGWEVGQNADSARENIDYYEAPNRVWGYDVGLQLSPAGPAATRFVTSSKSRNEFYNEPPVNDPYISMLCKAAKSVTDERFGPKDPSKVNCPS